MEFRFLSPERSYTQRKARVASVLLHALVVGALLMVPWAMVEPARPVQAQRVTLAAPPRPYRMPELKRLRLVLQTSKRAAVLAPALAQVTQTTPAPGPTPAAKPRLLQMEPDIEPAPAVLLATPEVKIAAPQPAARVATGTFETAAATLPAAETRTVSTGGFGESVPGATRARTAAAATAGFGDAAAGVAARAARTVASGGFETARTDAPRVVRAVVEDAGFAPVEILEKPRPIYSEEARRLRVEGSVQVRVVFSANGEIRVVGVVRSLGHGLDEAATAAAARIRFRPARRAGQPVDSSAVVQIVFQLA